MTTFSDIYPLSPDNEPASARPVWRRSPTRRSKAVKLSPEELCDKLDGYFAEQYDTNEHPTFCDMAGAVGFDSVTQLVNHARRRGGTVMRAISRSFLAVGAGYEDQAQAGSRTAMHMLERMPAFDTEETASQAPDRPFMAQREVNLNITGVRRPEDEGSQLTAQQAYLQLIKNKTYSEVEPIPRGKDLEGDYDVIELEDLEP